MSEHTTDTHTKGPLTVKRLHMYGNCCDYGIIDEDGRVIGEAIDVIGPTPNDRAPARANATLWAAAGDLLAACEMEVAVESQQCGDIQILELYKILRSHGWDNEDSPRKFIRRFRRDAIAKAKGLQSSAPTDPLPPNMTEADVAEACSGTPEPLADTPFNRMMMDIARNVIKEELAKPVIETRYIVREGDRYYARDGRPYLFKSESEAKLAIAVFGPDEPDDESDSSEKASHS
jgi:hypothetical protein